MCQQHHHNPHSFIPSHLPLRTIEGHCGTKMATHPRTMWDWEPTPTPKPFLRLNGGCAWRESREAEGKLVFRVSSVTLKLFKECLGLLNVPLLLSKAGIPHKGVSCPAQAPSGKKSHCPGAGPPSRRCMLHCPPPRPAKGAPFRPVCPDYRGLTTQCAAIFHVEGSGWLWAESMPAFVC